MFAWPILEAVPVLPGVSVSPHALGSVLGFLAGMALLRRRLVTMDLLDRARASALMPDILALAAIGALVGMRLSYVLTHLSVFLHAPLTILDLRTGGASFLGGVTGAFIAITPRALREARAVGKPLLRGFDAAAPGLPLGLLIGRVGDLIVGDHLGPATDAWFGWRCTGRLWDQAAGTLDRLGPRMYPVGSTPLQGCYDTAVVQTALLDAAAAAAVLAASLLISRRSSRPGIVLATCVLTYAPLRILGDVARLDRRFGGLTPSQWALLAGAALTAAWLIRERRLERAASTASAQHTV